MGCKRTRQVQGVQRADGCARKLAAGSVQDLLMEMEQVPVPARPGEGSAASNDIAFLEPIHHLRPDQYPVGFDEGEDRREHLRGFRELPSDFLSFGFTQEPGENSTRFSVQPHRVPRSASSSFADEVDRSPRERGG